MLWSVDGWVAGRMAFLRYKRINQAQALAPRTATSGMLERRRQTPGAEAIAIAMLLLVAVAAPAAAQPLADPIPDAIEKGDLMVAAVPFVRAPRTSDPVRPAGTNNAYARIQYLLPVPKAPADSSARPARPRLAFNDARGVLYLTDAEGSTPRVYLDLRQRDVGFSNANFPNESGFLGFAFHPQFATPGRPGYGKLYTAFSATTRSGVADYAGTAAVQHSVIREWTAADANADAFRGTSREVLRVGQFAANHNVGTIAFNPVADEGTADHGLLYICFGDGGRRDDPYNHGQQLQTLLGAIARIDPLDTGGGRAYGIPADNPFAGRAEVATEIWAYGLRHPQQFSWDADGRMFLTDIGQDQIEEVNIGASGANYGWRRREGGFSTEPGIGRFSRNRPVYPRPATDPQPFVYPVAQYDHDEGYAIGGGYAYWGRAIPALRGKYVFTDFPRGRVFAIDAHAAAAAHTAASEPVPIEELRLAFDGQERELVDVAGFPNTYQFREQRVDARLGVDHDGEPYLLAKGNGWIYKLAAIPATRRVPLFLSAAERKVREGFVRVVNRSDLAGEVTIDAVDDAGGRAEQVTLSLGARQTRHFNSTDLETGNEAKGLAGRTGEGQGDWRLELSTTLVVDVLTYLRAGTGFLTTLHETVGPVGRTHEVVFFNPASNRNQVSRLRVVNDGDAQAQVTITGRDDNGEAAPGGEVTFTVPAAGAATFTAAQLENGHADIDAALGDGHGKWRLSVSANQDVRVLSLLHAPDGEIANLSTRPASDGVPFFPAAGGQVQGFARIVNRSAVDGVVTIRAIDDAGVQKGPVTLSLAAEQVRHFNSVDLEEGNTDKGLSAGVGAGEGAWRLVLETELDIEPLAYIRADGGFVTSMHDLVPLAEGRHEGPTFNPASNVHQESLLRVINTGQTEAAVTIAGVDDAGAAGETEARFALPAGAAATWNAAQLETGAGLEGRLGDGEGKWRLEVSADQPLQVMSLLRSPAGNIANLSGRAQGAARQ